MIKPFKKASVLHITQGFSPTHQAIDIVSFYGTPLVAPEDCRVVDIWGDEFTPGSDRNLERGYGIKLKGSVTGYTHLYWHTNPVFPVEKGDMVREGQIVAFMGNSGYVLSGGRYVPLDERTTFPHNGRHLHQELWSPAGVELDPSREIDWITEPTYSIVDWLRAWFRVLKKMGKLVS